MTLLLAALKGQFTQIFSLTSITLDICVVSAFTLNKSYRQNSIHLRCVGVETEILETDISKLAK